MKKFIILALIFLACLGLFLRFGSFFKKDFCSKGVNIDGLALHISKKLVNPELITILVTRHAEKTKVDREVHFEQWHLSKSDPLSARGWQRAGALTSRLILCDDIAQYGDIVAIYAPTPDSIYKSVRPVQTATPTANFLGLTINTDYNLDQPEQMAQRILMDSSYFGKVVYIAWEHDHIPSLVRDVFKCTQAPATWNSEVFDLIYLMRFDKTGKPVDFQIIPQQLLYGDSSTAQALPELS